MTAGAAAVLYPAIAEVARRAGDAPALGLIDLGGPVGRNLDVDRAGITYSNGQSLGDRSSPVQLSATLVRGRPVPTQRLPEVVARVAVDGDPLDRLPDAFAEIPEGALPVVITTWALSRLSLEGRLRFLHRLQDASAERPVAWVSVEGVGVAPAIPTLGDRRAFGHSTVGVAVFERDALRAQAVGRCWSRGRWLEWLGAS